MRNSPLLAAVALLALAAPCLLAQTELTLVAAPGTITVAPGTSTPAWLYDGQYPGPVIRATEGELLRVTLVNQLPEPTSIHWHGLATIPHGMDGVPGLGRPAVAPGQEFTYELLLNEPGTYFYHPHHGAQLDQGLFGVLIVDPAVPDPDPPDAEILLVLDDLAPTVSFGMMHPFYAWYTLNGATSSQQTPFVVNPGDEIRLRLVNASAATNYIVAVDGHPLAVTHADGRPVVPVTVDAVPIGAGERWDATLVADTPGTWSIAAARLEMPWQPVVRGLLTYAGTPFTPVPGSYAPPALTTGTWLDYAMLASAVPVTPLAAAPDQDWALDLTWNPLTGEWFLGGETWPNASPLIVQSGDEIRTTFTNFTPADHPMHVHGHLFRLHGTAGGTGAPLVKDTVLVRHMLSGPGGGPHHGGPGGGMMPPGAQSVTVELVADNPGRWVLHCHNLYHFEAGMGRLLGYDPGDADGDGLADIIDREATVPNPVLVLDDQGGGFVPGSPLALVNQWPAGELTAFYVGPELPVPSPMGDLGIARIFAPVLLGTAVSGQDDLAILAGQIPPVPALTGFRAVIQALSTAPTLTPPFRISTAAVLRVN